MKRLPLVIALAGCDKLLDLERIPDAPAHLVCAKETPAPFLCADFDEATPQLYASGTPLPLPPDPGKVSSVTGPATSPPNALWIDSTAESGAATVYKIDASSSSVTIAQLDAVFELSVPIASSQDTELTLLGARDPVFQQCLTELYIDTSHGSPQLWIKKHCGVADPGDFKQILPGLPEAPLRIRQYLDLPGGTVTVTAEGHDPVVLGLGLTAASGTLALQLGVIDTGGTGPKISFDDIEVATIGP